MIIRDNITLDITDLKDKGVKLATAIHEAVKHRQSVLVQEHYNELLVTQDQYEDLMKWSGMIPMYGSKDMLFKTPDNIMEVRIKDD